MTQKVETWNRSVGWYSFEQQKVSFRRMSMNSGTRPVLVHLEEPVTTTLSAEGRGAGCRILYIYQEHTW